MTSGIKYTQDKIDNILQVYKDTKSIYQAAKKNNITYKYAKKYIYQYIKDIKPVDKRTLLPALKAPGSLDNNIYINKEDIITKDIDNISDKNINIYNSDKDKVLQDNNYKITKESYLIKSIDNLLSKFILRYKREYKDIPINSLYLHFGVLFDKLNIIMNKDKLSPDSQVVINFYGNESKVKDMINKIRDSKKIYSKDISNV